MKPHTSIYLKAFSYDVSSFIPCEVCGTKAVDIHHIKSRGAGGSKQRDRIENLQAVCRQCHINYGDVLDAMANLYRLHKARMIAAGVKFDVEWIDEQINKYTFRISE